MPHRPSRPRSRPARLAALALGAGLLGGLLAAAPASAEDRPTRDRAGSDRAVSDRTGTRDVVTVDVRPHRERPTRDLEVLQLGCEVARAESDIAGSDVAESDDATRVRIGCRWRAAESERAVGYQLWRIVDRGERELVARGGLDLLGARDVVSADTLVVRYAVIAVDENGKRVGQSRVQRIVITELDDHDRRLADRAAVRRVQAG